MTFLTSLENKFNEDKGLKVNRYRPLLREHGSKSTLTLAQLFETLPTSLDMTSHQSDSYILFLKYSKPYIVDQIDSFILLLGNNMIKIIQSFNNAAISMNKPIIFINHDWKFFGYMNSTGSNFDSCPKLYKVSQKGKITVLGPFLI